jgi:uncharacterized protein (DUF1810 family)
MPEPRTRDSLQRFLDAQAPLYEDACAELKAGCKQSHWMWFIFPQLRGLGLSATAQHYGIASRQEAQAYLQHPVLGERLKHGMRLLLAHQGLSAQGIFGATDALKFRSCATLFAEVAGQEPVFQQVLDKYDDGVRDSRTLELLGSPGIGMKQPLTDQKKILILVTELPIDSSLAFVTPKRFAAWWSRTRPANASRF